MLNCKSYGIICIYANNNIKNQVISILQNTTEININSCPNKLSVYYDDDINNVNNDDIKFLLITKKHSYAFIDILLCKYNVKYPEYIQHLITKLTQSELYLLQTQPYKKLLKRVKLTNITYTSFLSMKKKFDTILPLINQCKFTKYTVPEWEIPKGKKEQNETELECAIREFQEETNIKPEQLTIFKNIKPMVEIFSGSDNRKYIYTYYYALFNKEYNDNTSSPEASSINFYNLNSCLNNIRPYNTKRKKILYSIYTYLNNLINTTNTQQNNILISNDNIVNEHNDQYKYIIQFESNNNQKNNTHFIIPIKISIKYDIK